MLGNIAIQRVDNVGIVVENLDVAVAFFAELSIGAGRKGQIEGPQADRTVGLIGVRSEIAMMRAPDGHGKLELTRYHAPRRSVPGGNLDMEEGERNKDSSNKDAPGPPILMNTSQLPTLCEKLPALRPR